MKSYLPSGLWGPGWNDKKAGQLRLLLVPSTCTLHVLWATPPLWIIWQFKALRTKVLPDIRWPFQLWTVTLPPIWSTLLTEAYTDLFEAQRRPTPHRCFRLKNKVSVSPSKHIGHPTWLSGKEPTSQCRRCEFNPWVRKIPWRREWQPTPVCLPGKSHVLRSLAVYSPWIAESDMNEVI